MRSLLLGAAFFSIQYVHAEAPLKIAIADTGFCSDKALIKTKLHKVLSSIDLTSSNLYDCQKIAPSDLTNAPRFHGQNVLNEFLSYLPMDYSITIQPLVVYNERGDQEETAWLKAIEYIKKENFDLVLTASGLITEKKLASNLPSIWFVPSGRAERKITLATQLFPQSLAPLENLFIIGDYYDGKQNFYDQALLYQAQIDYYLPAGKKHFSGTSRAVAQAMGQAIKYCYNSNKVFQAKTLRECLVKKQSTLSDSILKKEFKTF